MKLQKLFIFLSVIGLMSACAPTRPFTQSIRDQYKLTTDEIMRIQFYNSHDIILVRGESSGEEKEVNQGELKLKSGEYQERVVIPKGTPGVVERVVGTDKLAVSFDSGDNKLIVFGNIEQANGYYKLLAAEWENGRGKVNYDGKIYYTTQGAQGIYLTFRLKKLEQYKKDEHVAKGKRIK